MEESHLYQIALTLAPNVGARTARKLISYAGSAAQIFKSKKRNLLEFPGIGPSAVKGLNKKNLLLEAEKEIRRQESLGHNIMFLEGNSYPWRLKECEDAPIVLYQKGELDLNASKVVSIVGTRKASDYGIEFCQTMAEGLSDLFPDLIIVSGMAYGIDAAAHASAMRSNLKTVAVLGHGFGFVYPSMHRNLAKSIGDSGSLLTEFPYNKKPEAGNFVSRNRIIAGLADATIVVESKQKGGALITADMANSYHRDVFALPGKSMDKLSKGCNELIRQNRAGLIASVEDFLEAMNWEPEQKKKPLQSTLCFNCSDEERQILDAFKKKQQLSRDELCQLTGIPISKVTSNLFNMEFKGWLSALPGNLYKSLV